MKKLFYKEEKDDKLIFHIFGIKIKFRSKHQYFAPSVDTSNIKISVVINTYNADRLLEKAIQSVIKADEIIVCDMYSNDKTIEISKKYGCKIVYHEKLPQPDPARNFAISKASGEWILILDADEIVPPDLWECLVNYANNPLPDKLVVSIPRKNWFLDGFLNQAGSDSQLRFFKKWYLQYEEGHVHVPPKPLNTEVFNLINASDKDLTFYHYSYKNLAELLNRQNIYTTEEVKKADLTDIRSSKYKIFSIFIKYLKIYFREKRYKDGFRGFAWCVFDAFYEIIIYMKTLEKKENFEDKQNQDANSRVCI